MARTGRRIEAHATFRYAVEIDGISEAIFSECTLPPLEVETHDQKEGGYNTGVHQLPGRVRPGKVTLKKGVSSSPELMHWYRDVVNGKISDSERNMSIVMYDSQHEEVMRLNFERVYPVKWSGPNLNMGENSVAIESLELAFAMVTFD